MIRPSKAEKILGRVEKGAHLLAKGIAIGHTAYNLYKLGSTLAPFAAAML